METTPSLPGYAIRVRGQLDERWRRRFEGFDLTLSPEGDTIISGRAIDQATLFGALSRIRDLGLELVAVQQLPGLAPEA